MSSQWRVRESCCLALVEFLRGRNLADALDSLNELWTSVFKVMDDIKETVRLAANNAAMALSRTSVSMCEGTGTTSAATIQILMTVMLEEGLRSTVGEVKNVAVETLLKISKAAGPLIGSHLPVYIPAMLEAAGEQESKQVSRQCTLSRHLIMT